MIGAFPFRGNNNKQTIEKIREGKFDMCSSKWQFISDDGKDLLIKMLTIDSFRLTAEQAFNHNFIQNNTFFITPKSEALKSAIDNLCSYQYQNKLIEAIGTYISAQLMTNRQKHDLSEVFKSLDKNGDGKLSKNELVLCFNNAKNNREFNTTQVLANVDTDHNGFVDYNEFLKSAFEMNELISRKNLKAAFGMFDINGDGVILAAELKEVLEGESADDKN